MERLGDQPRPARQPEADAEFRDLPVGGSPGVVGITTGHGEWPESQVLDAWLGQGYSLSDIASPVTAAGLAGKRFVVVSHAFGAPFTAALRSRRSAPTSTVVAGCCSSASGGRCRRPAPGLSGHLAESSSSGSSSRARRRDRPHGQLRRPVHPPVPPLPPPGVAAYRRRPRIDRGAPARRARRPSFRPARPHSRPTPRCAGATSGLSRPRRRSPA